MAPKKVRIELDQNGIKALLRSPEIAADLERRARNVARTAGDGMHSAVVQGRDRVRAQVWTGTYAAKRAEAEDRALTRAIDAARD